MDFKIFILFSIIKIAFSAIEDIKVVSSNIDSAIEEHVISTVFALFEKHTDFKTFAKTLVENMDNKYGKSWICQIQSHSDAELYASQQSNNSLSINYKDYHVTLFKIDSISANKNNTLVRFFKILFLINLIGISF
jgi:hypothetical protein